jgi:hypothetical protein
LELQVRGPIQPTNSLRFSRQGFVQPARLCTAGKALYSP